MAGISFLLAGMEADRRQAAKGRCYRAPALRLGRHDLPFITVGLQVHATLAQMLSFGGLAVSSPIYPILRSAKNTLPFPK